LLTRSSHHRAPSFVDQLRLPSISHGIHSSVSEPPTSAHIMSPDVNSLAASEPSSYVGSPTSNQPRRISSNSTATASETILNNPPSPHLSQLSSLHAAAAINAGLQRSPSSNQSSLSQARRRSSVAANINLNNPAIPGPGEMQSPNAGHAFGSPPSSRSLMNYADPNHHRAPSLGQIHQELENEQEAQVVR